MTSGPHFRLPPDDTPPALEENSLSGFSGGGMVPPWVRKPYRLVSLLEIMERFRPESFTDLSGLLGRFRFLPDTVPLFLGIELQVSYTVPPALIDWLKEDLVRIEKACSRLGLINSAMAVRRMVEALSRSPHNWKSLRAQAEELHGRLFDELSATMFLCLNLYEAEQYSNPRRDWGDVVARYPSAIRDIEEAGKCLALGRATACVFHLMRVMEAGLRSLGTSLNDPSFNPKTNPSWDAILKRCTRELEKPRRDRAPEWQTDDVFFSAATANLRAVQFGWRNPSIHVEISYTEEEARGIHDAVRSFMKHLATRLSE